jgi:hypothetical protein
MPGWRRARRDAGGQHDVVEAARGELGRRGAVTELSASRRCVDAAAEVAQRLVELLLAGDALGEVELAADLARPLRTA